MIFSIPHGIFNELIENFDSESQTRILCWVVYPDGNYRKWISIIAFLTVYLIPLSTTTIVYSLIGIQIWKQRRSGGGDMTPEQINLRGENSKKKTIKILVLVVIVFVVSWLPLNLYYILNNFDSIKNYYSTSFLICYWFAMSSVCYNPFIYFGLNKQYQKGAIDLLTKLHSCGRSSSDSSF